MDLCVCAIHGIRYARSVSLWSLFIMFIVAQEPHYLNLVDAAAITTVNDSQGWHDRPYKGRLIGSIRTVKRDDTPIDGPSFVISGNVYAVDDQLLYLHSFTYDGGAPGIHIWGILSDPRSPHRDKVFIIPFSKECGTNCASIPPVHEENVIIALPRNASLNALTEITFGTRNPGLVYPEVQEKYATVRIPTGFVAPRPYTLPSTLGHTLSTAGTSSGEITIQDSRRIHLEKVTYDGTGGAAYFWVDRSPHPTSNGYRVVPNSDDVSPQSLARLPLNNHTQYDALLDLRLAYRSIPGRILLLTVFDLKSVAIYERVYGTVYGDSQFNGPALKGQIPPALDDLVIHRVSELAAKQIRELNYRVADDIDRQISRHQPFSSLQVSPQIPLSDSDPVAIKNLIRQRRSDWNQLQPFDIAINSNKLLHHDQWNCEVLDNVVEIRWKIDNDMITMNLTVPLWVFPDRSTSYFAFGLSGSQTKSEMIGSDVTVGYFTSFGIGLTDLILGGKAQCNKPRPKLNAVCPRVLLGGKQISEMIGTARMEDGKFSYRYRRPITKQDFLGKDIPLDGPTFVVWATGPLDPSSQLPEYHVMHAKGSTKMDFGRKPHNNCASAQ